MRYGCCVARASCAMMMCAIYAGCDRMMIMTATNDGKYQIYDGARCTATAYKYARKCAYDDTTAQDERLRHTNLTPDNIIINNGMYNPINPTVQISKCNLTAYESTQISSQTANPANPSPIHAILIQYKSVMLLRFKSTQNHATSYNPTQTIRQIYRYKSCKRQSIRRRANDDDGDDGVCKCDG